MAQRGDCQDETTSSGSRRRTFRQSGCFFPENSAPSSSNCDKSSGSSLVNPDKRRKAIVDTDGNSALEPATKTTSIRTVRQSYKIQAERSRRARINSYLQELKEIMLQYYGEQANYCEKMEVNEILKFTLIMTKQLMSNSVGHSNAGLASGLPAGPALSLRTGSSQCWSSGNPYQFPIHSGSQQPACHLTSTQLQDLQQVNIARPVGLQLRNTNLTHSQLPTSSAIASLPASKTLIAFGVWSSGEKENNFTQPRPSHSVESVDVANPRNIWQPWRL